MDNPTTYPAIAWDAAKLRDATQSWERYVDAMCDPMEGLRMAYLASLVQQPNTGISCQALRATTTPFSTGIGFLGGLLGPRWW